MGTMLATTTSDINTIDYTTYKGNGTLNENGSFLGEELYFEYPEEMLNPWNSDMYFFPVVLTYLITFIVGVTGNVIVIVVMAGDQASRNVTGVFLVSLAVADLLLLTLCAPLDVAHYFVIKWDHEGSVCKMAAYVECLSAFASVLNLVAVTMERFVVIVFPIRSRSLCTMSNCSRVVVLVWIVSLVCAVPATFVKETKHLVFYNKVMQVDAYTCNDTKNWLGHFVAWYRLSGLFILPSVVMIACYARVILELWVSTKTMDQLTLQQSSNCSYGYRSRSFGSGSSNHSKPLHSPLTQAASITNNTNYRLTLRSHASSDIHDVKRARQQVIKMLILLVVLFLLCWGPRLVMELVINRGLETFSHVEYNLHFIGSLLPFVHSCLNPIVYCFMSTKFRRRMLRCFERTVCYHMLSCCCPSDKGVCRSQYPSKRSKCCSCVTKEAINLQSSPTATLTRNGGRRGSFSGVCSVTTYTTTMIPSQETLTTDACKDHLNHYQLRHLHVSPASVDRELCDQV